MDLSEFMDFVCNEDYVPIKAPFAWPGSKARSLVHLAEYLPYAKVYVEPFGGSGSVLLARRPSTIEVFNDRNSGVVDFYRAIKEDMDGLLDILELTTYSREEWMHNHDNWRQETDRTKRAAMWYSMIEYSFGSMGRNIGRTTGSGKLAGKMHKKFSLFPRIHERIKNVFLENADWTTLFRDYNSDDSVFYCDPPYLGTDNQATYQSSWKAADQANLLKAIFQHEGFVALSGYGDPITESMDWDDCLEWDVDVTIKSANHGTARSGAVEKLWIKEAY